MDIKKITAILCIIAHKIPGVTKLKVMKLLYYIDKEHFLKYGRLVTFDRYIRMDCGPIPSHILDIVNDQVRYLSEEDKKYMDSYIAINMANKYRHLKPVGDPDLFELSKSEIEVINHVIDKFGKYREGELIDLTHEEEAWKQAQRNKQIDLRYFLDEVKDKDEKAELLLVINEGDFA